MTNADKEQSSKAAKRQNNSATLQLYNFATLQLCIAGIGLLIFFALALQTAVLAAPTADESVHLFRGRVLWQTGQMRFQAKHMPLAHWLNGSLLFTEPTLPDVTELPSWSQDDRPTLAREFLWDYAPKPNIDRVFLLARLPIIWLGMLLGAVLARWARLFSGLPGQWVVLLLFAFSPNLLANFSLATTDGPLAATFVAAVFAWQRYRKRPSFWRWLLAGVILGLALSSKLTAIILLPILLLLSYSQWRRGQSWRRPGLIWLSILPVAGLVFWLLYGFELRALPGIPFSIPAATYVNSFLKLQTDSGLQGNSNYNAYLLGEISRNGWWYYFVVVFLIKTPIPALLLLGTAVFLIIRQRQWQATAYLWLPAGVLFAFASYSRLNIGYRHILSMLPFVYLLGAGAAPVLLKKWGTRLVLWLALGWYIIGSLRQHPHHLAYFNELIGGSTQGYHYLGDSNIDWGQSLKLLAGYVNRVDTETIRVSYFGSADPAYYGLQTSPFFEAQTGMPLNFARANPASGQYAISVNHLLGQVIVETDLFDWFRHQEPIDNIGYSILVYDVPQPASGSWIAHCTDPAPLLDTAAASQLVGQEGLRQVYFDCRHGWVFPNDGAPGWYILPQQDSWPVADTFPERLRPVYVHGASALEPSYAVWYWDGQADLKEWAAVSNSQVNLPAHFSDTADLMGYSVNQSDWWTIWQAQAAFPEPITIAGHLYTDAPTPLVADGLGYSGEQWRPGDWFVQVHSFAGEENGRYLETGLYNYLTGERLTNFIQLPAPE